MSTPNIVFLCAYSARSNAYLQALQQHQSLLVHLNAIVSYGPQSYQISSHRDFTPRTLGNLFCPDLNQHISQTLAEFDCPHYYQQPKSLDDEQLINTLKALAPDIIIYSGYGGQIVPESLLAVAKVLHVHSGLLPDYRGSTTLYHEVIEHNACAASAIFLEKHIDTGPILNKQQYPLPPANMDVDYLYDNLIRADLLIKTLYKIINNNIVEEPQTTDMPAYYIIHPLLKHLALFRIDAGGQDAKND